MWRQSMQTKAMAPSWQAAREPPRVHSVDQKARERGLVHFADTHRKFSGGGCARSRIHGRQSKIVQAGSVNIRLPLFVAEQALNRLLRFAGITTK